MKIGILLTVVAVAIAVAEAPAQETNLTLTSPAFTPNGSIPSQFTCEGDDKSPPLTWAGVPAAAKSLVLIVDDPDAPDPTAPQRTWVHWVVYNLPPNSTGLPVGVDPLPSGARAGSNDWKKPAYGGPCPPTGRHRYFHKLYALDAELSLSDGSDKAAVEAAMDGHILAQAELIGTYEKKK